MKLCFVLNNLFFRSFVSIIFVLSNIANNIAKTATQMSQIRDFIVVGQGLAGTLISFMLERAGKDCLVIDAGIEQAASSVAAGIINPVTGRRYVKSWRIDTLLPFARRTYQELEALLGTSFASDYRIIRSIGSVKEENDWLARSADPSYEKYILDEADTSVFRDKIEPAFAYGELDRGMRVDIAGLIRHYRSYLTDTGKLLPASFDHSMLQTGDSGVTYGEIQARGVIFCEGYRAKYNPLFNYLPFHGDKGEVLIVRIPGANFDKLLKQNIFIVPLEADLYWVGTTYFRSYETLEPTPEGKTWLLTKLSEILRLPFEVVDHRAAVRPTVKDRRPFLGAHPDISGLWLFNGLGTKGTSLGPYWADHLTKHILEGQELDPEVNINRFGES